MPKSYHFLQGTNVVGPLAYDRLLKLVQDGVVVEHTMLSDDASNWKPAIELVPQLFRKQSATSAASTGPTSGSGAERWYVQANGQQYGPISYTELFGWVSSKSVVAETLVRKSESGTWQRADTVFTHLQSRSLTPRQSAPQPKSDRGAEKAGRRNVTKPSDQLAETEFFATLGVGTFVFLATGSVLLWFFVLEPGIKEAIGPLGWLIWTVVIAAISHFFTKGKKK